jgi:7-cyano-7-deazaguanine synthase
MAPAVVLLTGGLDSSTTLALVHGRGHARDLAAARRLAAHFSCRERRVLALDPCAFSGSAFPDAAIPVPVDRPGAEIGSGVPITYVPARNVIFLGLATGCAEVAGADDIYLGITVTNYSG